MDYEDPQSDLRWGNLTAAQTVYARLQSDLLLVRNPSAAAASTTTEAAAGHASASVTTTANTDPKAGGLNATA